MLLPVDMPERDQIVEIVKGFPKIKKEINYSITNIQLE